jgi:hypothetical protein
MPTEPDTRATSTIDQSRDDQYLALLGLIERHLGRIANALEAFSPEPIRLVKDLGPVRDVPKPGDR